MLLGAYQNPASTAKPNAVLPGRAYYYSGLYAIPVAVPDGSAAWEDGALSLDAPFETTDGVRISYRVGPAASRVVVDVHDIAGRRVRHFEEGLRGPGAHALDWDKRDERGVRVARSVYIVRLTADATSLTRKVVVLRP